MRQFVLADGRRLHYREAGHGQPLILLHGWAMSSAVFTEALTELADEFHVLAPDLRGHGASEGADGYAFADFAADIGEWLDGLDLRQAAVVGWSMGGQVLLELFAAQRARLAKVVLMGSTPRFTAGGDWAAALPVGQVRAMARDLKNNYLKTMGDFFALQFAGEAVERQRYRQIVDFAVHAGRLPEPAVALAALESLRRADLREKAGAIDCPALVVHGALDRITLPAAGRWLADHLPQARREILPEVGHAPFLTRPAQVFGLWREFLR
ncbi:MAG: alpha/beta fold hydrolase [Desulfuromonadales bacterium]